jgi:hypothetical protein
MREPPTPQHTGKGVKHGMLVLRFEYVVWYLQEESMEEELCVWPLVGLV